MFQPKTMWLSTKKPWVVEVEIEITVALLKLQAQIATYINLVLALLNLLCNWCSISFELHTQTIKLWKPEPTKSCCCSLTSSSVSSTEGSHPVFWLHCQRSQLCQTGRALHQDFRSLEFYNLWNRPQWNCLMNTTLWRDTFSMCFF